MGGSPTPQLALELRDAAGEVVDQREGSRDVPAPGLRHHVARQQRAAADAEEVTDGTGDAVGEEPRVDAVLETGALADEVQAKARPLAFGADRRVGQPDRRHEVPARELGEHARVDAVGLAGERCESPGLERVGDRNRPARELQLIVDEPRAGHRFDRALHGLAVARQPMGEAGESGGARWDGTRLNDRPVRVENANVESLAAEVESCMQHRWASLRGLE
jgi:hypothetical protein